MSVVLKLPNELGLEYRSLCCGEPTMKLFLLLPHKYIFTRVRNGAVNVQDLLFGTLGKGHLTPQRILPTNVERETLS